MKTNPAIWTVLIAGVLFSSIFNCKKESIKTTPTVTLLTVTNITSNSALSGGEVTSDGGAAVMVRGVCWSNTQNPSISNSTTSNGPGKGSFVSSMTGLMPGTTYYLKSYGTNAVGTGYSSQSTFTTTALAPVLTTTDLSSLTAISVNSGGNITSDGGSPVTAQGVCWSKSQNPTIADSKTTDSAGSNSFTSIITGLSPGSTYYIRAYATNSIGTAYGNQVTTTTLAVLPTVTTTNLSAITSTTATGGGNITNDGGATIVARGICWSTSQNPALTDEKTIDGTGNGIFTSTALGLSNNITYYLRAYATNAIGTAFGNEYSVILYMNVPDISVTDIDGNVYKTVKIGNQVWMAENLKTTKYQNGDTIPTVKVDATWATLTTGAYCTYENGAITYGALYNWHAVADSRHIAPAGWHVPTYAEWTTLTDYLGGEDVAGGKLKETGTIHWIEPNSGATNSSGFTALPGGVRSTNTTFFGIGYNGDWWTASEASPDGAWNRYLSYILPNVSKNSILKTNGFSVRCLRD